MRGVTLRNAESVPSADFGELRCRAHPASPRSGPGRAGPVTDRGRGGAYCVLKQELIGRIFSQGMPEFGAGGGLVEHFPAGTRVGRAETSKIR